MTNSLFKEAESNRDKSMLLLGLLELSGAAEWQLHALFVILLLARIAHPIGMMAPERSTTQMAFRGPGILGTWLVLLLASVLLILGTIG